MAQSIHPDIFRLYDIRGTYPDQLNEETVYRVARAFIRLLRSKNKKTIQQVAIGRDARLSSQEFTRVFARGVQDEGCVAHDLGLSITPSVYFFVSAKGLDGGVNITASHQPNPFNGLKLVGKGAVPIGAESGLEEIRRFAEQIDFEEKRSGGKIEHHPDALEAYVEEQIVMGREHIEQIKTLGLTVAADAGNGSAGPYAARFFQELHINFYPLCFEPDGRFPNHVPDPLIPENTRDLIRLVNSRCFSFGVAFDGDGDRILFFTEAGKRVRGDEIVALVARELLKEKAGAKILYDIRASRMVEEVIRAHGGAPVLSPVGHTLVKQAMKRENVLFGGELSGHYYLGAPYFFEMPFFVLTLVTAMLAESGLTFSSALASLQSNWYHSASEYGELNFEIEDKQGKMEELALQFSDGLVSRLDGIRVDYPDWWFNARPSANDPVLRLIVEADSQEKMEEKVRMLRERITG